MADADSQSPADEHPRLQAFVWPTWQQRKRIVHVQAWLCVVGAYLVLVPAWLLPQEFETDSRVRAAVLWFFFMVEVGTEYIGWVLLVIGVIAALRGLRWLAIAAIPLAAVTMGPVFAQYIPTSGPPVAEPTFRVMSINLLCINRQTDAVLAEIRDADPDVILIQEYAPHWHEAFQRELLDQYPHYTGFPQGDAFGAAIYSRLPFRERPGLVMSMGAGDVPQIRAVIDMGGRDVVFYNIHLLPPRYLDYVMARNAQFAALLKEMKAETLPVILSGDFNFPGTSPHARVLEGSGMTDAHDLAGYGRAATWPVNGIMRYLPVPGIRIDHIYLSPQLTCTSLRTGAGPGSDHRSLIATLGFSEKR